MSTWRVEFSDEAARDFLRLDRAVRVQVDDRIAWLAYNFDHITPLPLHEDLTGHYKLRAGDWRVVYTVERSEKILKIREIKHRNKVYKHRK